MSMLDTEPARQAVPSDRGNEAVDCLVRVVYRDAAGQINLDWPTDQIRLALEDAEGRLWVDIHDPESHAGDLPETLLQDVFKFHPLAVEDALKETHVPKVDDWGHYLYIVFHSLEYDPKGGHVKLHELDAFLGKNYLVTYHTEPLGFLEQDRRNIERDPTNRLRLGVDHLLYHFLDLAVADFLPAIEALDLAIDTAQE